MGKRKKINSTSARKALSRDSVRRKRYRRGKQPRYFPLQWHTDSASVELDDLAGTIAENPAQAAHILIDAKNDHWTKKQNRQRRKDRKQAEQAELQSILDDLSDDLSDDAIDLGELNDLLAAEL